MDSKNLLIVGIDPGTTTGYAVLDINGNLVQLGSSKDFNLNSLISETIKLGRAILVGTDKLKTPGLVQAFATKLGAKIIIPKEDLKVNEKKSKVSGFVYSNEHEGDALASALFAYRTAKPLLDKIDFFAEENKKQGIRNMLKEIVLLKKISIKNAVDIIEKRSEEGKIVEEVIFEKKIGESDFLRIYNRLKKYESELRLLKNYNNNLIKRIMATDHRQIEPNQRYNSKNADHKENRIAFLSSLIRMKDNKIKWLELSFRRLTKILMDFHDLCILKKLDTLGIHEFRFKNRILNVQKNDILMVGNPNIVSRDVVEILRNKVFIVIHKSHVNEKNKENLPFIFIDAKNLNVRDFGHFGIIEREELEAEKSKINWVRKIVEDYKKEKSIMG